jgi:hypothetical protein
VTNKFIYYRLSTRNKIHTTIGVAEGRMQAYGWSLPARYSTEGANGSKGLVSVPVPIYCRPLNTSEPGMKVLDEQTSTSFTCSIFNTSTSS